MILSKMVRIWMGWAVLALIVGLAGPSFAKGEKSRPQDEDKIPPRVNSLTISPETLDLSNDPGEFPSFEVTYDIIDAEPGQAGELHYVQFILRRAGSPDIKTSQISWGRHQFASDTAQIYVPLTAPAGEYQLLTTIKDRTGNFLGPEAAGLSTPNTVTIINSNQDIILPELVSFTATPAHLNSPAGVNFNAVLHDAGGLKYFEVALQRQGDRFLLTRDYHLSDGFTETDATRTPGFWLEPYAKSGTYDIMVTLRDAAGNSLGERRPGLATPAVITLTNADEDIVPPQVVSLTIPSGAIDLSGRLSHTEDLYFEAELREEGAGVQANVSGLLQWQVMIRNVVTPGSGDPQFSYTDFHPKPLNGYETDNSTYQINIPAGAPAGQYDVLVSVMDKAGNDLAGADADGWLKMDTLEVINNPTLTVEVIIEGYGEGDVLSDDGGILCGRFNVHDCIKVYDLGSSVILSPRLNSDNSEFEGWSGACTGTGDCNLAMDQSHLVRARFRYTDLDPTTVFSSVLPAARSAWMTTPTQKTKSAKPSAAGDPVTVFATAINAGIDVAQKCSFGIPDTAPVTLSYQEVIHTLPITLEGPPDHPFDMLDGVNHTFVLSFTPITQSTGEFVFPQISCENAIVAEIPSVNSVFLSVDDHAIPDILSIGATPNGNGIISIPRLNTSFMSVSAINIGAGDVDGSRDASVTVSIDTGDAVLPLALGLCETDAVGACISEFAAEISATISDQVSFFAVFVGDQEGQIIPLDASANRVFLRIRDAEGIVRSVTSAAIQVN